jgi:hypothetical protein
MTSVPLVTRNKLIGLVVLVPDERALQLDRLDVVVVEAGNDLGRPVLVEARELVLEVDDLHCASPAHLAPVRGSSGLMTSPLNPWTVRSPHPAAASLYTSWGCARWSAALFMDIGPAISSRQS